MSLSNLIASARQSLLTFQAATNVTGQNIANAETPGYTRRRLAMSPTPVARGGVLFHDPRLGVGGGVSGTSLERVRSAVMDRAVRAGRAGSDGAGESARLLATLEGQLAPDGGAGLLDALGGFWDAWSAVADDPTEPVSREALLDAAAGLAGTLRATDARLADLGAAVQDDLATTVDTVNTLLAGIAAINGELRSTEGGTTPDLNAEDRRDALLDELAGLVPIQTRAEADGTVTVSFGGMVGVQGAEAVPLTLATPPGVTAVEVRAGGSRRGLSLSATEGGVLGAQLGFLRDALPEARSALDDLAARLVADVNAVHITGTGLDGSTGLHFFDPTGTTAATLRVSPLLPGPEAVAASTSGQPGDGSLAERIAGIGDALSAQATGVLSGVGTRVQASLAAAEANAAVADHAAALRDGVSKVSLDEEMTSLIRYQQAYAASARVLETADTLFDTLLAI